MEKDILLELILEQLIKFRIDSVDSITRKEIFLYIKHLKIHSAFILIKNRTFLYAIYKD